MTDIYTAIMKAADHIERNPSLFNFSEHRKPDDCGTPGCAIGWIGLFSGREFPRSCSPFREGGSPTSGVSGDVVEPVLGVPADVFYSRMAHLAPGWTREAPLCASALRLYAAKYHAPAKPIQQPPDWEQIASLSLGLTQMFVREVA